MQTHWHAIGLFLSLALSRAESALGPEVGMRPKRRPSESDHRVTIDLSALRPSLPGLVLYKYGDLAPKLVQVDLSALNPRIQPHVIWPQFNEMEFDDRPFDFDAGSEAIPYLTEDDMSPRKMAKMTEDWMQGNNAADIYDFVQDDKLVSLQGSLPLADEVIVPLDWEEGEGGKKKQKKNVFLTRGWRAGGERGSGLPQQKHHSSTFTKHGKVGLTSDFNSYYSRGSISKPSQRWSIPRRRETESENLRRTTSRGHPGKKDDRISVSGHQDEAQPVRVSSQESWSVPRQYWNVPHLFVNNWQ